MVRRRGPDATRAVQNLPRMKLVRLRQIDNSLILVNVVVVRFINEARVSTVRLISDAVEPTVGVVAAYHVEISNAASATGWLVRLGSCAEVVVVLHRRRVAIRVRYGSRISERVVVRVVR